MSVKRYTVTIIADTKAPFERTVKAETAEDALRQALPDFFKGQDYKALRATVSISQLSDEAAR